MMLQLIRMRKWDGTICEEGCSVGLEHAEWSAKHTKHKWAGHCASVTQEEWFKLESYWTWIMEEDEVTNKPQKVENKDTTWEAPTFKEIKERRDAVKEREGAEIAKEVWGSQTCLHRGHRLQRQKSVFWFSKCFWFVVGVVVTLERVFSEEDEGSN